MSCTNLGTPIFLTGLLAVLGLAEPAPAAAPQTGRVTNADIPRDNVSGPNLNFERTQLQPLEFSADGTRIYALNSPGARLAAFDVATGKRVLDIPVGIGGVSVARRPGTDQLWVVDEIASTVFLVDPAIAAVVHSVRVGAQPHGIAFTPSGDRAYVTCSGVDRVDVLDGASARVIKSIPVPVKQPRGIVWTAGHAWLVPLLSGNNSATFGLPGKPVMVVGVAKVEGPGLNPLPDRDLLAIATQVDPKQDDLVPALTRTGLGTVLFSISLRPGTSELWIPNTEALNTDFKGEKSFIEGQVVSNRITVVNLKSSAPPLVIDLDALAPPHQRPAQPTHVTFNASGTRAYVCGFGTDLIGVLDVLPGGAVNWVGSIELRALHILPAGAGPRQALVDSSGTRLFVYHRIGNALGTIDLSSLPASGPFSVFAPKPVATGFDPLTGEERHGRFLFDNARFSKSMTSSCNSCHVDAHTDGVAWDISVYLDPEGTPPGKLSFPLDAKGPLVTRSTRRLIDIGPWNWRGDCQNVLQLNGKFATLLENQVNGQPGIISSFGYLRHYLNNLCWPPNPKAPLDRDYTPEQLAGADLFMNKPTVGRLACVACHQLPLGTSGEIVINTTAGMLVSAAVPPLRGVTDKLSPPYFIGGKFGKRTELGAGLTHGGALATLQDVMLKRDPSNPGGGLLNLTPQEADQIAAFLEAFDWGLAPAAGYAATANVGNLATFAQTELAFLEEQAERGNCDLVYMRTPLLLPGMQGLLNLTGRYDPETQLYTQASRWVTGLTQSQLLSEAAQGRPVTFLGLPLGMGEPMGLDREMDGLWDIDERRVGSNFEIFDTDMDSYPDGWEVERGMDPTVPDSSAPDAQAPALAGPVKVHWATTNTIRFEFDTDEMARALVSYNGCYPVQRVPLGPPDYATHHDVTLFGLEPGTVYALELELSDPAENKRLDKSAVLMTRPLLFGEHPRVESIQLYTKGSNPGDLVAAVTLVTGNLPAGPGYAVEGTAYQVFLGGGLAMVASSMSATTDRNGLARIQTQLPPPGPPSTLIFVLKQVTEPPGAKPHLPSLNKVSSASIVY